MENDQQQPAGDNLAVFSFGEVEIRVAGTRETPLFCVADICAVLELGNSRQAVANHPEEEKGVSSFDTLGGRQEMQCVTEPGLYRLIFRSYKPKAEEFRRWVFREVLPALRNTGHYAMPGRTGEAMDTEGRVTTFIRVTEALVKLGAKPLAAGNAALRWLPTITAGMLLPSADDRTRDEAERIFTAIIERSTEPMLMVKMEELVATANDLDLLQEHARGTERSWRTRMGMALRQARGAVLETARGQWEVRQRAGARVSEWILRQTRA